MKIKNLLQPKFIIFYLAIISLILFLIGTLVIGSKIKDGNEIWTLLDTKKYIKIFKQLNAEIPQFILNYYWLNIFGLISAVCGLICFFLTLLPIKKIIRFENLIWWSGTFFELVALILVISGNIVFITSAAKFSPNLKFKEIFYVGRFVGLIICFIVLPVTIIILNFIWYKKFIKFSEKTK